METLRAYLNSIPTAEQEKYARKCGTSIGYLRKSLNTKPRFDAALALALDVNSGGKVSRFELRGDVFGTAPKKVA